jgi:Trypsin
LLVATAPAATGEARLDPVTVQLRAGELTDPLRATAAGFGGVWIGPDGRVKIGIAGAVGGNGGRDGARAARRLAVGHGLRGETDLVPVRHTLQAIEDGAAWLGGELVRVNQGAPAPLLSAQWVAGNAVELRLPAGALTSTQHELVEDARARLGDLLVIGHYGGRLGPNACTVARCDPPVRGGVRMRGSSDVCTVGFLARGRGAGNTYAITAGHCAGNSWTVQTSTLRRTLGNVTARRFSSDGDAMIIHVANRGFWKPRPWVYVTRSADTTLEKQYKIRDTGRSVEGARVCLTGSVNGSDCGRVLRLGITGTYRGVTVRNLIEADFCGGPGDSGGPVYSGHVAYGIEVANDPDAAQCRTYYQDISSAENFLNVDVMLG